MHSRPLLGMIVTLGAVHAACAPMAPVVPSPAAPVPTCSAPPPQPVVAAPGPAPTASAAVTPPAPPAPPPPPPALEAALEGALKALAAGDMRTTDRQIAVAQESAGDDAHLAYLVARVRAARFVMAGDYDRAAAAFVAVMPGLARHPELRDEFWSHNAMMMIREAQGDPAAALAEDDQATLAAARGTWDPQGRATLAFQKDRWHRAYLTRMLAESRTGSVKQALVQYAQAALDEYRAHGGFPDSVAILDAYFAALDGRREAALAAAKRVDPAQDGDSEDLYLVVVGLEAGGDHAAAEVVRRAMRQPGRIGIARTIMLRWLAIDARPRRAAAFTPWHAGVGSAATLSSAKTLRP
jgi:hypothetical protein